MPKTHRFFSPSASSRWFGSAKAGDRRAGCTASLVVDVSNVPEKVRADAERGTRLHSVAEECLRGNTDPADRDDLEGADLKIVQVYVDIVRERVGQKIYEFRSDLVPGLCGGTADAVVIDHEAGVLEIIDLKTGTWPVESKDNTQLAIYWEGVRRKLVDSGIYDDVFETARLTIVQPALDNPVDSWTTDAVEVSALAEGVVYVVQEVLEGKVEFRPSPEACKFCRAKPICPALSDMVERAAVDDFSDHLKEARPELDLEEEMTWSDRLKLVPFLREWCKAVESAAAGKVLRGEEVEGFKAVEGRKGNRSWKSMKAAVKLLTSWGFDETEIYTDPSLRSPNQIETLLKELMKDKEEIASMKKELADVWVEGKPGPPTIVPESDRRKAIDKGDLARRDFSDYITGTEPAED